MSTPLQPYSLSQQAAAIGAYAADRGYDIVRTYEDAAVSGVDARKRPAFRELLATVLTGHADFQVILVHDVSRWGRFQDPDEAAHYEFLCSQEGVRIEYCAEAFGEGVGMSDALMKSLKRAMAAEFSRELGAKVRAAQRRYSAQGYWLHGAPGYGLARQIVEVDGRPGRTLAPGERNADRSRRTILTLGPPEEAAAVRLMFALCGEGKLTTGEIARQLNRDGPPAPAGGRWSAERIRAILINSKYAGDLATQRRHTPLGGRRKAAPPEDWVTAHGAVPRLVSRQLFARVQAELKSPARADDATLLAALEPVAKAYGVVSETRLKALGVAYHRSYRHRFGSVQAAFALIGHSPAKHFPKRMNDDAMLCGLARLFQREGDITPRLIDADPTIPSADHYRRRFDGLANAYARIGFVRISRAEASSPIGQARVAARQRQIATWAREPDAEL